MWESRVLRRAFERLELHEGKLSRAVLRGGGGGDVTSLPDTWVGNHPGLPGPEFLPPESTSTASSPPWTDRTQPRDYRGPGERSDGGFRFPIGIMLVGPPRVALKTCKRWLRGKPSERGGSQFQRRSRATCSAVALSKNAARSVFIAVRESGSR